MVSLLTLPLLTACSLSPTEPEIKVVTKIEKTVVPIVERPKPVQLYTTKVRVVNKENLDAFIEEFEKENGNVAFVALSIKDYENLALNIADIRRYLNQQTQIIVYYEDAVSPDTKEPQNGTKETRSGE